MTKHVKGERGIAAKMKRAILNSRYWCVWSFGLSHTFTFMRSFVLSPFSLLGLLCTNPTLMMDVEVSVEYVDLFMYTVVIVFLFEICLD